MRYGTRAPQRVGRLAGAVGGLATVLLTTLGVVVVGAGPAFARDSYTVTSSARCNAGTGSYDVYWTIANLAADPLLISNIAGDGTFGYRASLVGAEAPVSGTISIPRRGWLIQHAPGGATSASLSFRAAYRSGAVNPFSKQVKLGGRCGNGATSTEEVVATPDCDGMTITLNNTARNARDTTYSIRSSNGFQQSVDVAANSSQEVVIPGDRASGVYVQTRSGQKGPFTWAKPADCPGVDVIGNSTCSALEVTITNPTNAEISGRIEGEKTPRDVKVAGGAQQVVKIKAAKDLVAHVAIAGQTWDLPYETPPGCVTGAAGAAGAGGLGGGITGLYCIGGLLIAMGVVAIVAVGQGGWEPLLKRVRRWREPRLHRRPATAAPRHDTGYAATDESSDFDPFGSADTWWERGPQGHGTLTQPPAVPGPRSQPSVPPPAPPVMPQRPPEPPYSDDARHRWPES